MASGRSAFRGLGLVAGSQGVAAWRPHHLRQLHITKIIGEAVDKTRREERREHDALKGQRHALLWTARQCQPSLFGGSTVVGGKYLSCLRIVSRQSERIDGAAFGRSLA